MVATDVASRGIGMVDCDLAPPLPFPQLTSCGSEVMLCSLQRCAPMNAMTWSGILMSSAGCLARMSLGS